LILDRNCYAETATGDAKKCFRIPKKGKPTSTDSGGLRKASKE
jgi:hypothetical protein